ncbi:helix-turn-helix domain-containing protein, partial [Patescibacteria group bacterium]|nr:helix-turn-helix domain-containing protein [Patescibacteria group bacterium]
MKQLLEKNLISTKEASELSGYNADYLSRLCREGKIDATQVGRTWLVSKVSLEGFMQSQAERKRELAESLSKEREREYSKATSPVTKTVHVAERLREEITRTVVASLPKVSSYSKGLKVLGQSSAVFATSLILTLSAYAAGNGSLNQFASQALSTALEGRLALVNSINSFEEERSGIRSELARNSKEYVATVENSAAKISERSQIYSFAELPEKIALATADTKVANLISEKRENVFAKETNKVDENKFSFAQFVERPQEIVPALLRSYVGLGVNTRDGMLAILDGYTSAITTAGDATLEIGVRSRDVAVQTPGVLARAHGAIGLEVLAVSNAITNTYAEGLVAWVTYTPEIPPVLVGFAGTTGNLVGGTLASTIKITPVLYERGVVAFTQAAPELAETITRTQLAVGTKATGEVQTLLRAQEDVIAGSVRPVKENIAVLAEASVFVPGAWTTTISNQTLGFMGRTAASIESAPSRVAALVASPLASFNTDWIPAPLRSLGARIAEFFAPKDSGLAVVPVDDTEIPRPGAIAPVVPTRPGPAVVYIPAPANPITYAGVTQEYVDAQFSRLQGIMNRNYDARRTSHNFSGDITRSVITDSTVDDSTITNSVFEGGTINGSVLTVATTSINGTLTVTGDTSISGTLSAGGLSVSSISSSGQITAPYFTATSTTEVSTFPNLIATQATTTNATSTNFFSTNAILANATSTNLFATNATLQELLGTNATITNATTTSLYSTLATIVDAFFTNITATLATLTNAVITNLTATNSTLTNATTTNATTTDSLALTYVTPSRLLSVNANGTVISADLSSWVAGTSNQVSVADNGIGGITLSLPSQLSLSYASSTGISALDFFSVGRTSTTTIRGNGATSTFAGGVQASIIEGLEYIAGPYVLATSTTATSAFSGNIAVGRNATFGTTAADTLTVNSAVGSNLIPSTNNTYDLGSPGAYWRRGYIDELVVNNLSAASSSVSGTVSDTFTLNSDNATNDLEDISLIFKRGSASPNALLTWNSSTKRFEFNMPVYSQNGIFTYASTTALTVSGQANIGSLAGASVSSLTNNYLPKWNNGTFSNSLIYDNGSSLGVGTSSPSATLSVAGNSLISGTSYTEGLATFLSGFNIGGSTFTSLLGNGLTNVGGTLTVSTTSLASGFFQQDGNTFGALATLGTTDAYGLRFVTGG